MDDQYDQCKQGEDNIYVKKIGPEIEVNEINIINADDNSEEARIVRKIVGRPIKSKKKLKKKKSK